MLITIVIPVYNEEKYIKKILKKINEIKNLEKEIIVVNDNSTDGTKQILDNEKILYSKLINNKKNMGKGFSCREGIKVSNGDIVIYKMRILSIILKIILN